ncbi:helix-turn-helix domain-containing protein [Terrimonas pollutisoli]|uniref:helix-turn-helix domain-containing protein n=1 Tax=Terrimonas pollutisoli TaxID=3034147 RepID=UPI0023EDCAFF|nr:helix-turn-helix domain-containing protein [Terrimonas sp. H1YJ31]
MNVQELQQLIFQAIKRKLPADASIADEVAGLLEISTDSAYRRMRGEKLITFEELYKIAIHYRISLDQLMSINNGTIQFQGQYLDKKTFRFEEYMTSLLQNVAYINSFKEKEFYYSCKDMPIFHHFVLREIAAFKWFFWLKTYFQFPEFERKKFSVTDYPDELFAIDQKVLTLYKQIPSVEIWNIESMSIIFRQIDFYLDGHVFQSDRDAYALYEAVEKLWNHLEEQAALGYKFYYNDPEKKPMARFRMYFNEVLLGDNTMLITADGLKFSYITHSTINFMLSRDIAFNENLYNHLQNQMKRSTLISAVSEKERSKFFRIIRERISRRKEALNI